MTAEIISPAALYPPSLANLLNPAPVLHLTPEDLVDATVGDYEDRILEMSIDNPGRVDACIGSMTSEWEMCSAVTSGSMPSILDDDVHLPDNRTNMVNEVPASLSSKKPSLAYFQDASEFAYLSPNKRPRDPVSESASLTLSSDDDSIAGSKKLPAKKRLRQENLFGPTGIGQSAMSSRKTREAAK